ncbi:MAG: DMT family transporter [Candidatus Eisenbacteria bacterium]|nr:DMT family transporter [Candidatus Eisenbacteria bacterium]MBU1949671.1 DMT family transporter [Candidatus Eisenbacteria bacterium]
MGWIIGVLLIQQTFGALTFPAAKIGLAAIEPFTFAFYRFMIASVILLTIVQFRRFDIPVTRTDLWRIAGLGILIILLNQTTYLVGQSMTTAGDGALLFATTPIWICVLARIYLKEKLTWRRSLGIGIAICGVVIIILRGAVGFGPEHLLGDLIIFESVLAWAAYSVLGKPLVMKYGAIRVTAYALTFGAISYLPFGLYRAITFDYTPVPMKAWIALLWVALGTSVISYLLWYWVLKQTEASRVAAYHNVQPIIAASAAYFILGEPLGIPFVIGGLIVLVGVLITELRPHRKGTIRALPE